MRAIARAEEQVAADVMRAVRVGTARPDEEDAGGYRDHAGDLDAGRALAEHDGAEGEHEHGGGAARDGIDDADLTVLVGACEQREVGDVQRGRGGRERQRGVRDPAGDQRHRRQQHDAAEGRDGGRGLAVARARDQHVPGRVHERGAQGEAEGGERHVGAGYAARRRPQASAGRPYPCSGSFMASVSGASMYGCCSSCCSSSWYADSAFTAQMSWSVPFTRLSTARIAVSMEWSELL